MTSALSARAAGIIADFAASLGLPPPQPARDGSVSFVFARSGHLTFTPADAGRRVLISLARQPSRIDESFERQVLAASGFDETSGRLVHAGLAPDGTVLAILDLDDGELDLPAIENALRTLNDRHAAMT